MGQTPCRGCDGRYLGCHSECEKYQSMKAEQHAAWQAKAEDYQRQKKINVPYERRKRFKTW